MVGLQAMNGRDGVCHPGGYFLGCKLSSMGLVKRCVVVVHEVGCNVATRNGTERDATGCLGCARETGVRVEKLATGIGLEIRVTLTGCVSDSRVDDGLDYRGRGGNCGPALGGGCNYNRTTFPGLDCGCVSVRGGQPSALRRVNVGEGGFGCPSTPSHQLGISCTSCAGL